MAVKRGFIRVNFVAVEPQRLIEILAEIEAVIAEDDGATADLTLLPERLPPMPLAAGRPEV